MITIAATTKARDAKPATTACEMTGSVMTITKGRSTESYDVAEIPVRWDGRAFDLRKANAQDNYQCFVARNGQDNICDCYGFTAHGHCKHIDCLRHLIAEGEILDPHAGFPDMSPEELAELAGEELPF